MEKKMNQNNALQGIFILNIVTTYWMTISLKLPAHRVGELTTHNVVFREAFLPIYICFITSTLSPWWLEPSSLINN